MSHRRRHPLPSYKHASLVNYLTSSLKCDILGARSVLKSATGRVEAPKEGRLRRREPAFGITGTSQLPMSGALTEVAALMASDIAAPIVLCVTNMNT